MTIHEIARRLDTRVLGAGAQEGAELKRAVSSDRMSDLLEQSSPDTLLVTRLATAQLVSMAELMDVPALCVIASAGGEREILAHAERSRVSVVISPHSAEETRRRLADLLAAGEQPST